MTRPRRKPQAPRPRPGFTLVEILTVIVIIGILVGLIVAAAMPVRNTVRNWRQKTEITEIGLGMEDCKTALGMSDYPPDFSDPVDVRRCIQRAFPRCNADEVMKAIASMGINSPSEAIVFWLGGKWDANQKRFIGFSNNPLNPLDDNPSRKGPFFDFEKTRLEFSGDMPTYRFYPKNDRPPVMTTAGNPNRPYLYFKAQTGLYSRAAQGSLPAFESKWEKDPLSAVVKPFLDSTGGWIQAQSYQILCPGLNGLYADEATKKFTTDNNPPVYPTGLNYGPAMFDDITNFSGGKIENDLP